MKKRIKRRALTIPEFREIMGMSQKEFADAYKIPLRTLQNWEIGRRTPPPYVMALLHRAVFEDKLQMEIADYGKLYVDPDNQ